MHIKHHDLVKWKNNSLKTAEKLGYYDKSILDFIDKNVSLKTNSSRIPLGMWYGFAHYDKKNSYVEVYEKNISCESVPEILLEFRNKGIPESTISKAALVLKSIPRKVLFKVYNQSGMDHELIGHIYNNFAGKDHGEKTAVQVQLEFAKERSGWLFHKIPWKIVSLIAPTILHHHKKDEF